MAKEAHGGCYTTISLIITAFFGIRAHGALFRMVPFSGTVGGAIPHSSRIHFCRQRQTWSGLLALYTDECPGANSFTITEIDKGEKVKRK